MPPNPSINARHAKKLELLEFIRKFMYRYVIKLTVLTEYTENIIFQPFVAIKCVTTLNVAAATFCDPDRGRKKVVVSG